MSKKKKEISKIDDLVNKKNELGRLPKEEQDEKKKTRLELFNEEGIIKIYPTEGSFKYALKDQKVIEGTCHRKVFYNFFEFPETDPYGMVTSETFALGYAIEEMIKTELKEIGELKEENEEFQVDYDYSGVKISGRIDAKLNDGTLVEIKSMKHHPYSVDLLTGKKGNYSKGMMLRSHIGQASTYLTVEKLEGKEDPTLIMWYKDRNQLGDYLFELKLTETGDLTCNGQKVENFNVLSLLHRYTQLKDFIKKRELPPRDFGYIKKENAQVLVENGRMTRATYNSVMSGQDVLPFECNYCVYKTLCLNTEE